jgi:pyruvoyl-dependent arginine decarboxylase (PvlArgDC)
VGLKRKRPDDDDGETVEDTDTAEHLSAGAVVPLKVARVETEVAAADVAAAAAGVAAAAATAAPATLVIEEPPLNVQEGVTMATEEPPVGMETTSYNNAMNEPRAEQAIQTASAGGGTSAAPDSASGP